MSSEAQSQTSSVELVIPFPSEQEAKIACGSLSVDKEPKRGGVQRSMKVIGNAMHVRFECQEVRTLRVSLTSFFEHVKLVSQTMAEFGPPR